MKAVINEKETPVKKEYPYLGKATKNVDFPFIVLFTSYKTGTVVQSSNKNYWPIGQYDTQWAEHDCFTPFAGSITLSND